MRVNTPMEQPTSKALANRAVAKACKVAPYFACSYGLVANRQGSFFLAYSASK
jgi:hypothetical protein